ncbi:PREDICTED: endoplasmic reticulum-Golgi intermediate compartment protein 3-like [Nicotiana attenuata]|uniref:Protein disulfide-isomerase 5-4 n=1 Tax=Nicotiana attenuata TaxID=49451 RepID=A0A314LBM9_NICAT|nr:PREDICTED: endoplasmic reticulum-Golgi intermediate compartment protein 3-like [Nicotiana attenuata]OIT39110.1 protein disulfide-isomerase 5-4 [Nicotiana attenuata]
MERVFSKLRNLDAYPKINEDFYNRTLSGGIITLVASLIMLVLFVNELGLYIHSYTETQLIVDTSRGGKLHIHFDITFPAVPCSLLSLDARDISGEEHFDIRHDIFKKRIDSHGAVIEVRQDGIGAPKIERPLQKHGGRLEHNETYCGSCFGAETADDECCNSCEEVREAYRKRGWAITNTDLIDQCKREGFVQKIKDEEGEGCNIHGSLEVNKVAGNFHFAAGKSFHQSSFQLFELIALQSDTYNISHRVNKLAFGDSIPGVVNPLDGVHWTQEAQHGVYQYFLKVVPTIYKGFRGRTIDSNQFSATEHFKSSEMGLFQSPPGVYFFYDLSPIKVTFTEQHVSFFHFLTSVCAIIGGVFTVAGIVDAFIYHGQKAIKKKVELGKFG